MLRNNTVFVLILFWGAASIFISHYIQKAISENFCLDHRLQYKSSCLSNKTDTYNIHLNTN